MVRDRNCDVLAVANIGDGCDLGFASGSSKQVGSETGRKDVVKLLMAVVLGVLIRLGWRWGDG